MTEKPAAWQPIESAPKDGTTVDLWTPGDSRGGYRIENAYWLADVEPPGWYAPYQDYLESGRVEDVVTHWMHLPGDPQ